VHKIPPHQTKQMIKYPMQFAKFRYGRVDKMTYWMNHDSSQGVFPKCKPSLIHAKKVTWTGERILGMGFMTYKGS
jgi:hypothetical protein